MRTLGKAGGGGGGVLGGKVSNQGGGGGRVWHRDQGEKADWHPGRGENYNHQDWACGETVQMEDGEDKEKRRKKHLKAGGRKVERLNKLLI